MEIDPASPPTFKIKINSECTAGKCFGPHSGKLPTLIFGLHCSCSLFHSSSASDIPVAAFSHFLLSNYCLISDEQINLIYAPNIQIPLSVSESSEEIYKSFILRLYVPVLKYKSYVCIWEREERSERKEVMARKDSLQVKRASYRE